jgi:hypothetical protein
VLVELARAGRVILGFDIIDFRPKAKWLPSVCGESTFDVNLDLDVRPWSDLISVSLEHALCDLRRTPQLLWSAMSTDDLWYEIVSVNLAEWEELCRKHPRGSDGVFRMRISRKSKDG